MNHNVHKLAACSVALSALVVGCTPVAQGQRPVSLASSPALEKDSAKLYQRAQSAVQAGKLGEALSLAERTVELSPRDVGYRMLLGDLYLKNGRFASAETSFSDVVALDSGNVRGTLSLSLSMIAQGKNLLATAELEKLEGIAAPGDLGLAYALAGQHGRARTLLESAASEPKATGRVRQNLALAYALAGDWQKARVTAAQDVSPTELSNRLAHWATLASPADSYTQVAALLGVTPAADSGQPLRLALAAPEGSAVAYAEAAPAPVQAVAPVPVVVAAAPVQAVAPAPVVVAAAPVQAAAPAPVVVASVPVPDKVAAVAALAATPVTPAELPVQFAAAAEDLVKASPAVIKASLSVGTVPVAAFKPARLVKLDARPGKIGTGRFVVQIGAYRNLNQANRAWGEAARRYGIGADKQPLSTTVTLPGRGTFYRLSVAPFEAPGQAARVCQTIRTRGGACFVRSLAGDAPLHYAARNARRG
ncbi:MAG TPA: SPOR domain-containing protein [Allosphingosinicella sp.]|jgi:Flp pilus assembly protein TadD|uniref:SPOR domain-containing protein n=1 Tax=Allosphingosinicella sp. TaxID=2823234 RepID=UPI002F28E393